MLRAFCELPGRQSFHLFVLEEDLPLFDFAREKMKLIPVSEIWRKPAQNIVWHHTVLPRLLRDLRLDVMHIPSYRRLLWRHTCPLVATIHDLAPFHVQKKYDWKRMLYGKRIVPFLARRQDHIIAISNTTATDIRKFFGVDHNRLHVVPNGVDHHRFNPADANQSKVWVRDHYQLDRPFFLYVARLEHPGKNHVRLIEAFNQFKASTGSDWKLVLAGSDWHGAEVIHAMVRQSPWASDISCLGFVPDSALPSFYRAAEALIFPSLFEGFGMPVVEAMACGCPVVCTANGALGEVAGTAALPLQNPENVNELARHLVRLAIEPALREELQAKGLTRAAEFDWKFTAQATLEVYRKAIRKTGVQAARPLVSTPAQAV
jgi:glycosyltransferase involved in cell wall biosynthesis